MSKKEPKYLHYDYFDTEYGGIVRGRVERNPGGFLSGIGKGVVVGVCCMVSPLVGLAAGALALMSELPNPNDSDMSEKDWEESVRKDRGGR